MPLGLDALPGLPVKAVLAELARALAETRTAVLRAPPGAGKTTLVPLALLGAPFLGGRSIVMLEPRRLAARGAAARMAALLGEPVGRTVGHRIRFDVMVSAATRIEVVTEGVLARRLQRDPGLEGVGLVIFDEFHERHLESDLALALCLDARATLREDLCVLVMSATLDASPVAALLGGAPIVTAEGRSYPVEIHYLPHDPEGRPPEVAATGVRRAIADLGDSPGDVLVFLPGAGEIRRARANLAADPALGGAVLHALYGDLPTDVQERALRPDAGGRRKIVLATSIAETSLTIEGVRAVVDVGWSRVPRFDPRTGLGRLVTVRVPKALAAQRAGRAGRIAPGACYRLWSEATWRGLPDQPVPEIRAADLTGLALDLANWGTRRAEDLRWLDPPPAAALERARALLVELGAIDTGGAPTPEGRALAELPMHPRLAHMLRRAQSLGLAALACDVAAVLNERDLLRGDGGRERTIDLGDRIEALQAFRARGAAGAEARGGDPAACATAERAARQWRRITGAGAPPVRFEPDDVGLLVATAYPDRVAWRREGGGHRYLLASGRGARLARQDALGMSPLLAAASLDGGEGEAVIHLAAPVALEELRRRLPERIVVEDVIRFDAREERVVARREERLGSIVLSERAPDEPAPERVLAAMIHGVRTMGLNVLPWSEAARRWQSRVLSLRSWMPDEPEWPDVSDTALLEQLEEWLGPWLRGVTRREQLGRMNLRETLEALLPWKLRARLEEGAPERMGVPSGSLRSLEYATGQPPVLAVKIQEMFGAADGPRVAWGRVPVTLHLLSPAGRPIQVTQDLRGFWERTYPEVRKELRGRYPRHPWPEDPWTAVPTAKAKRRG